MNSPLIRLILAAIVFVLPMTALVSSSAPTLPRGKKVGDDVLSLAHLTEVALDIQPLTQCLKDRGMTAGKVAAAWSEALSDAGIGVVEPDAGTPVLRLETKATTDPELTGTCFAAYLKVLQEVHVSRLNRTLMVPTYVYVMGGMDRERVLADTATAAINILLNGFIDHAELATEKMAKEGV